MYSYNLVRNNTIYPSKMFGKPKVVWSVISSLLGPVFLLFGLGGVDGLLHERVLRPACTSVLLIFHFYPFRLLTVTGFSCQSAACRWAVSAPCVSCCGVDFPSTWASAPCPCQPTAADWIHIVTCS